MKKLVFSLLITSFKLKLEKICIDNKLKKIINLSLSCCLDVQDNQDDAQANEDGFQEDQDAEQPEESPDKDNMENCIKKKVLKNIKKSGRKPNLGQSRDEFEMIKTEFQENLSRLMNNDTKKVGMAKCQKIISNNTGRDHLRLYLSQL